MNVEWRRYVQLFVFSVVVSVGKGSIQSRHFYTAFNLLKRRINESIRAAEQSYLRFTRADVLNVVTI